MPKAAFSYEDLRDAVKSSTCWQEVADTLGVKCVSALMKRRRRLEADYGPIQAPSQKLIVPPSTKKLTYKKARGVIFSDCHFWPQVYTPAYLILLKILKVFQPQFIIANGDILDGYSISRHSRIGWDLGPTPAEELEAAQLFLGEIRSSSKAKTYATLGNHDIRFDTKLASKVPEFEDVQGTKLQDHFPHWPFYWAITINDSIVVKHRWKGGMYAEANNTKMSGVTIATGHTHHLRKFPFSDYNGTRHGIGTGTLADPRGEQFLYCESNPVDWQSGFQLLYIDDDRYHFEPVEVIDGQAWWSGKWWKP